MIFSPIIKKLQLFINLLVVNISILFFAYTSSGIAAPPAVPVQCSGLYSHMNSLTIPNNESKQQNIEDLGAFNKAMTTGMVLSATQDDLFGIYLKTAFGDPNTSVNGKTLKDVTELLKSNPGLSKPHFQEYNIETVRRVYQTPESLATYLKSITATAGQIKSNLFQIDANLGYWKRLLNFKPLEENKTLQKVTAKKELQKNEQINRLFLRYLQKIISKDNRKLIADSKINYKEKILALFMTLNHVQKWMNKKGIDSLAIRQAMVDLVASAGFHNAATSELLKSKNAFERLEGLIKIFDERDTIAMELGFPGHFQELMTSLQINYPSLSGNKENIPSLVASFEKDVLASPYILLPSETVRIRSLSIQEAPFRSCLGGSDCSSRTYFSKALDPNYNYFTITNQNHESSGHITIVLGTAKNPNTGKEFKTAFVDKVQNVPNQILPKMLEAVRLSLLEKGYLLGIPENTGGHNGISNMSTTEDFIKSSILPNHKGRLVEFTPHLHQYNFENRYSRAYDKLSVKIIGGVKFDSETKISRGQSYVTNQAPTDLAKKN